MKIYTSPTKSKWNDLAKRPELDLSKLNELISEIFSSVESEGDKAINEYTKKFDGIDLKSIKISEKQIKLLAKKVEPEVKKAIDEALINIKKFHLSQAANFQSDKIETSPGVVCWQETRPIQSVGLYVPGGSAPLISTVLMLGVPAVFAGCKNIVLCTPPNEDGNLEPAICYAVDKLGIKDVILAGGAQAIAGLAIGTKTILKVDKIFGPGNQYVMAAKQYAVNYGVAIDMPAGPSEVLVIADEVARADYIAADLLSQAEHGPDSQVVLLTTSKRLVANVRAEILKQVEELPRKDIAKRAISNSFCAILDDLAQVVEFANLYAPEHLILNIKNSAQYVKQINNAGSVFIGENTPESAGDYASGTNHTLPTSGWARSYSGLSVRDFQRTVSFQKINEQGLNNLSGTIISLALAEGLEAHANAVRIRLDNRLKSK